MANLSCGNCKAIRSFSGKPLTCDACGWVCTDQAMQKLHTPKTVSDSTFQKILCLLGLGVAAYFGWSALNDSGFIAHDEMTIVYSREWQAGEYKTCTTLNGNGEAAPQQSKGQQNILCDGGVPSGRTEDGKTFQVAFKGKTYADDQKTNALLWWSCRKNAPDSDSVITCERTSDPTPPQ